MSSIREILDAVEGQVIGFDLETTGLNPRKDSITRIALYTKPRGAFCVPLGTSSYPYSKTLNELKNINPKTVFAHNAKFDLSFFRVAGINFNCPVGCTQVGSKMADGNRFRYNLNDLCKDNIGEGKLENFSNVGGLFTPSLTEYAKKDAELTYRLAVEWMEPILIKNNQHKIYWEMEMPVLQALVDTELHGIDIDVEALLDYHKKVEEKLIQIEQDIYKDAKKIFKISSPDAVAKLLYVTYQIPTEGIRKTKTGISTDDIALQSIAHYNPIIAKILNYRKYHKIYTSYTKPLLYEHLTEQRRIHPSFDPVGAEARMACKDPNVQNIGTDTEFGGLRRIITVPEEYVLVQSDLSQIEIRLAAYICKEPVMLDAIRNGIDLHQQSADAWGVDRQKAKVSNFGYIYGMSFKKFSSENGIDIETSKLLREKFFETYKTFKDYYKDVHSLLRKSEYSKTITGRRRYYPRYREIAYKCWDCAKKYDKIKLESLNPGDQVPPGYYDISFKGKRCKLCFNDLSENWNGSAINFPVQGSSADLLKVAYRNLDRAIKERSRTNNDWYKVHILALVHDEILVKTPKYMAKEVAELVTQCLENAIDLGIPIIAETKIVFNWAESKEKKVWHRIKKYIKNDIDPNLLKLMFKDSKHAISIRYEGKEGFKKQLNRIIEKYVK